MDRGCGVAGAKYLLQSCPDLQTWSNPVVLSPEFDFMTWTDPAAVSGRKFFRISDTNN